MKRVGIFGGAFDPPHIGHVRLAEQCRERLGLEELLIVPSFHSPHKPTPATDFDHRLEMCRLAFQGSSLGCHRLPAATSGELQRHPCRSKIYTVSDIERQIGGEGYTIITLRKIKANYPSGTKFFLIIGGDMLFYFDNWFRYESILKECNVVAAAREEDSYADLTEKAAELGHVKVLNLPVNEISSTMIRERLKSGGDTSELLTPEVADYISQNKLYV